MAFREHLLNICDMPNTIENEEEEEEKGRNKKMRFVIRMLIACKPWNHESPGRQAGRRSTKK